MDRWGPQPHHPFAGVKTTPLTLSSCSFRQLVNQELRRSIRHHTILPPLSRSNVAIASARRGCAHIANHRALDTFKSCSLFPAYLGQLAVDGLLLAVNRFIGAGFLGRNLLSPTRCGWPSTFCNESVHQKLYDPSQRPFSSLPPIREFKAPSDELPATGDGGSPSYPFRHGTRRVVFVA